MNISDLIIQDPGEGEDKDVKSAVEPAASIFLEGPNTADIGHSFYKVMFVPVQVVGYSGKTVAAGSKLQQHQNTSTPFTLAADLSVSPPLNDGLQQVLPTMSPMPTPPTTCNPFILKSSPMIANQSRRGMAEDSKEVGGKNNGSLSPLNILADVSMGVVSESEPATPELTSFSGAPSADFSPAMSTISIGSKSSRKQHLEQNAPDRPHQCIYFGLNREECNDAKGTVKEVCFARFRRRQEMLRHCRSVHGTVGDRLWVCPGSAKVPCGRRFARADALRRHLESIRCRDEVDGCSFGLTEEDVTRVVRSAKRVLE
ncbi:hypothetical protein BDR26DRAFT_862873 [Obelidium mucronatum]|nr:hypothetical protein BDR26DRAFT_862873 [Obelidium mucronatum]